MDKKGKIMSLCQHLNLRLGNRKARDDRWVANPQDSVHLFEVSLSFCGGVSSSRPPFLYPLGQRRLQLRCLGRKLLLLLFQRA